MTGAEAVLRRLTVAVVCAFIIVAGLYGIMWLFRLMDAMR